MKVDLVQWNDWAALYVDGDLKSSGHSLHVTHVLDALGIEWEQMYVPEDEDGELCYINKLSDLKDQKAALFPDA